MSLYNAKWPALVHKAGIVQEALPGGLQQLTEKYRLAAAALEQAAPQTQQRLVSILAQTDGLICAALYGLYKDRLGMADIIPAPPSDTAGSIDKIKLLAMKAKALNLKMNRKD